MHNMALNFSSWVLYNLRKSNICFYDTVLLYKNMTFIKISVRSEKVDHLQTHQVGLRGEMVIAFDF